jgi:SprT protein
MDQLSRNKGILSKYIPEAAVNIIAEWVYHYNFKLRIKKSRSSKYGDYRPPVPGENHLITINYNLNKYAFLITLIHEIAHLANFNKHKNRVKPHGNEWKEEYKKLMQLFLNENIFPSDVINAIQAYMKNPAASSCSDLNLQRTLKKYDVHETQTVHLEKIPQESIFKIEKERYFIKGEKLRKRFLCTELESKRKYLFNPLAEVLLVSEIEADNISQ